MALVPQTAKPMFGNQVKETQDGTIYTQMFHVPMAGIETATAEELQLAETLALNASGVPQYGAQFRGNANAFCDSRSAQVFSDVENNRPSHCTVTCTFNTAPQTKRDEENNPLDKRPDVTWSSHFERVTLFNCRKRAVSQRGQIIQGSTIIGTITRRNFNLINQWSLGITNSAGKAFNQMPEIDVPWPIVTVTQNVDRDEWDSFVNAKLIGSINEDTYRVDGVPIRAEQGLLLDRIGTSKYQGKLSYREVVTTILIKETHDVIVQDKGFICVGIPAEPGEPSTPSPEFGGGKDSKEFLAKVDAIQSPEESLLDGKGNEHKIKDGPPFYIHFSVYARGKHNLLNLPAEKI